jgi:hypothetical protein
MYPEKIIKLLREVKSGRLSPDKALAKIKDLPFESLGFANIDHHRALRTGMPEVIFGPGKSVEQICRLAGQMSKKGVDVLITRIESPTYKKIKALLAKAKYYPQAKLIHFPSGKISKTDKGLILVITAGTSDIPVAEEAAVTSELMGHNVTRIYDVGVAGIHRLLAHKNSLDKASVIIVVAGMEGALASVVAGLVNVPVIAVPTSIGYGASFGGLSALLGMLNSCVPGVTVVNIDNGFGAACAANAILTLVSKK